MKKRKLKVNKGFIVQKTGERMTIFDPEESVMYSFNETGSFIFSKLRGGMTEEEIVEGMVKRFGVDAGVAKVDFDEFLNDLLTKKIIKH